MKKVLFVFLLLATGYKESYAVCKNCIKYAAADAGGAYEGFGIGTMGGPMGQSLGIVVGGLVSSSFSWWLDHGRANPGSGSNNSPEMCCGGKAGTDKDKVNLDSYELSGFNHNEGLVFIINGIKDLSLNKNYDAYSVIYDKSIEFMSKEYNLSEAELNKQFTKESLYNELIEKKLPEISKADLLFKDFLISLEKIENDEDILKIVESYSNDVRNHIDLKNDEKERLLHSIQVGKFSYLFWSKNITN
jgi:hypothetical protein